MQSNWNQFSKKIRVCVVSPGMPHEHGGAELRACRHTQYLRSNEDTDAFLVALNQSENREQIDSLPEYIHPINLFIRDFRSGGELWRLIKLVGYIGEIVIRLIFFFFSRRNQFDILHVIFAASWFNLLTIPLAKILSKSTIIEMTDLGTDDPLTLNRRSGKPDQQMVPHRPIKYRLFSQADAFVSKCNALSDAFLEAKLPESKLFQIPSAVNTAIFSPVTTSLEKNNIRQRLGLKRSEIIILFVGRIVRQKGLHWLIPAFKELVPHYPETRLLVVGPTMKRDLTYARDIQKDVIASGLSARVDFVGRVDNVHEYMKAADIFALPTSHEGLSGAILEAMSSGLPIVTTDIPEISLSQIEHGVEGLLVSVGNTIQLSNALMKLIDSPNLRTQLGTAARRRVLGEFTPGIVLEKYLDLYHRLIQEDGIEESWELL